MKFTQFLLAAAMCATTAASAQTAPVQTAPRGTGSAAPSVTPSGTPAPAADPKGAVSAGEVFTTGSPNSDQTKMSKRDRSMKKKGSMSDGSGKMKAKM